MMKQQNAALIGLGVMGENLALNLADRGVSLAVYNRNEAKTEAFLHNHAHREIIGCKTLKELVGQIRTPRTIILMVKAGDAVDAVIQELRPLLSVGDILADCGNSHFGDTHRRQMELATDGIHFLGIGISGGAEGARNGPSIMPGGERSAWKSVEPMFKAIAAKADGEPCCEYMGPDGAGHFVKMVHNAIEYAEMQLLADAYEVMRHERKMPDSEIGAVFKNWCDGKNGGYLPEITAEIFTHREPGEKELLLNQILDAPGQKGTGKWAVSAAMDLGCAVPLLSDAVFLRNMYADYPLRRATAECYALSPEKGIPLTTVEDLEQAVYAARIMAYSQGFELLQRASLQYHWELHLADIAKIWRNGCIIRSRLLKPIAEAFERNPELPALWLDEEIQGSLLHCQAAWRNTVQAGVQTGVPRPGIAGALNHFDVARAARSPANLIQAQRDCFGSHGFSRIDAPPEQQFHGTWKR